MPILAFCPDCQWPAHAQPPDAEKVLYPTMTDWGMIETCVTCSLRHRKHPTGWFLRLIDWLFPIEVSPW